MAPLSFPLKEIGTRAELARRLGVDVRAVDLISISSTPRTGPSGVCPLGNTFLRGRNWPCRQPESVFATPFNQVGAHGIRQTRPTDFVGVLGWGLSPAPFLGKEAKSWPGRLP